MRIHNKIFPDLLCGRASQDTHFLFLTKIQRIDGKVHRVNEVYHNKTMVHDGLKYFKYVLMNNKTITIVFVNLTFSQAL